MPLNIVDVTALAVVGLSVFASYRRGFLKSAAGLVSLALSIIVAKMLSAPVATWVYTNFKVRETFEKSLTTYLSNNVAIPVSMSGPDEVSSQLTIVLSSYVDSLSFLKPFFKDSIATDPAIMNSIVIAKETGIEGFAKSIVTSFEPIIHTGIQIGCFLLLSLLAFAILSVVTKSLANVLRKLPLVGTVDSALGACIGLISGSLIALVFVGVLFAIVSLFGSVWLYTPETLQHSYVFSLLSGVKLGL